MALDPFSAIGAGLGIIGALDGGGGGATYTEPWPKVQAQILENLKRAEAISGQPMAYDPIYTGRLQADLNPLYDAYLSRLEGRAPGQYLAPQGAMPATGGLVADLQQRRLTPPRQAPVAAPAPAAPREEIPQYITERVFQGGGREGHGDWIETRRPNPAWSPGINDAPAAAATPAAPAGRPDEIAAATDLINQGLGAGTYTPGAPLASRADEVLARPSELDAYNFRDTGQQISGLIGDYQDPASLRSFAAGPDVAEMQQVLGGQLGAATRPLFEQYQETISPGLLAAAGTSGRFGSANLQNELQQAARGFGRSVVDRTGALVGEHYGRGQELAAGAAAQLGQLGQQRLLAETGALERLASAAADDQYRVGLANQRAATAVDRYNLDRGDRLDAQAVERLGLAAGLRERLAGRDVALEQAEFQRTPEMLAYQDDEARRKRGIEMVDWLDRLYRGHGAASTQQQDIPWSQRIGEVGNIATGIRGLKNFFTSNKAPAAPAGGWDYNF